jgi:integrase
LISQALDTSRNPDIQQLLAFQLVPFAGTPGGMKTMPTKCPGLTRRDNSANFRLRVKVPVDLLTHYRPKKELTATLGTSNREEACVRGLTLRAKLFQEFQDIRTKRDAEVRTSMSEVEMDRLALLLQHSMLEADDQIRVNGQEDVLFERQGEEQAQRLETYKRALARGDMSVVAGVVEDWLWGHGFQLDRASQDFKTLAHRFLKALVTATSKQAQRHQGEVVDTPPDPGPMNAPVKADPGGELTLSGLFDKWKDEKRGSLPETTLKDFGVYVRRFLELHGDLPLSLITKAHVRDYKDAMLKLPSVVRLPHKYRGLTVPELLELAEKLPDLERLSARTVNDKALGAVGAVLSWGEDNGYLENNPARRVKVSQGVRGKAVGPYSADELNLIFRFPVFTTGERPRGGAGEAAKWLPLLALFTGARLQELGRLQVEDIRQEWDVLFFDLTTAGTKTESSKRNVPVHPELVRLGLLDYLEARKKAGGGPLFPALKSGQDSPTESWSKWWGRYARRHGITDRRKVFHSFRHLVKDGFRNNGVEHALAEVIQGHALPGVGQGYGDGYSLQVKAEAMAKLQYPGLDLEHLIPRP